MDGNAPLLPLVTSALSRRAFLNSIPFSSVVFFVSRTPCGPCLHMPSQRSPRPLPLSCRRRTSGCCCSETSGSPCLALTACAPATEAWTNSATTVRPVPHPACLPPELFRWSTLLQNVRVGDMNIDVPVSDARRIQVVANLPMWHGAQVAIDATIVSPVTRTGSARGADTRPAAAVQDAAKPKLKTYPELQGARRAELVVLGIEVGGRFSTEAASFLRLLEPHRAASVVASLRAAVRRLGAKVVRDARCCCDASLRAPWFWRRFW